MADLAPEAWLARVREQWSPIATFCLFSGGGDSGVVAHRCREHYDALIYIATGTAIEPDPDDPTDTTPSVRAHVERFAGWLNKPLLVYETPEAEYDRMVLGGDTPRANGLPDRPLGFPGPAAHGTCYNRLKERQIEAALRDAKLGHSRMDRVLFVTGVHRAESQRRAQRPAISKKRAQVFVNPLIDWTPLEFKRYAREHALPQSDVALLLERSGECNCGAFAAKGERAQLQQLFPRWWNRRIAPLEAAAHAAGLTSYQWGNKHDERAIGDAGALCTDCQLRLTV